MESNNIKEKARFTCKRVAKRKAVVRKKENIGKCHENREEIMVYNHSLYRKKAKARTD